ncbi:MAG: septal ring lytic transglycosylase RlpA family protein [Pseudomonadota bacterium]
MAVNYKIYISVFAVFLAACSTNDSYLSGDVASSGYYDSDDVKYEKQKVGKPYQIKGQWYKPRYSNSYHETGVASWYGDYFHGRKTANGEVFDMNKVSAAHKTLPLPSYVEVTNLDNGRKLYVRVNDRGPFADNRIIDMSKEGAKRLGFKNAGLARVSVRQVDPPRNVVLVSPSGEKVYGKGYRETSQDSIMIASLEDKKTGEAGAAQLYDKTLFTKKTANPVDQIISASNQTPSSPMAPIANDPAPKSSGADPIAGIIGEYQASAAYGLSESAPVSQQNAFQPSQPATLNFPQYRVQVGVFRSEANVQRLQSQLQSYGDLKISPYYASNGETFKSVSLGPFDNLQKARETVDVLDQMGINGAGILQQ